MDTDTVLMLEGIGLLALFAFIVVVLAIIAWQSLRKDRARRVNRPVRAEVVESVCTRPQHLDDPFSVRTKFEAGGRFLTHEWVFSREADAQAFAAKYATGTTHEVIPSLDRGIAFLPADFEPQRGVGLRDAPAWLIAVPIGFLLFVLAGVIKVVKDAQ